MKRILLTTAIIAGAMWFHHPVANAALVACPEPGFVTEPGAKVENAPGTLTATLACQYLAPPDNSNVATIANINAGDFFGSNMWQANSAGNTQVGPGMGQILAHGRSPMLISPISIMRFSSRTAKTRI